MVVVAVIGMWYMSLFARRSKSSASGPRDVAHVKKNCSCRAATFVLKELN